MCVCVSSHFLCSSFCATEGEPRREHLSMVTETEMKNNKDNL